MALVTCYFADCMLHRSRVGSPRGQFWDPSFFPIYMLPRGRIIQSHNIYFHLYADDTQLYVALKPGSSNVSHILSCLTDIK